MTVPNDYIYDVFFSYKRHELTAEWTRRVHDHLKLWLSQEIQRPAEMFVDVETIETGDVWPDEIRHALSASKCMVSIWSPLYFQSNWCVSEWQTFLEREKLVNAGSRGLIAPVRFHDGDLFPPEARTVQSLDLTRYASCFPAFWASPRSLELEDQIKGLARTVAQILGRVPLFQNNWPIVEAKGAPAPKIRLERL
jgi:hypothetical protein